MNRMLKIAAIVLIAGLALGLTATWLVLARERERLATLEAMQRDICLGQRYKIEAILKGFVEGNVHDRIRFGIADMRVSMMCLSEEVPVSFTDADACWIGAGGSGDTLRCYEEPLQRLLVLYKKRF